MNESTESNGKIVIVSGPSGVGKSTICREAARRLKNVYVSVSVTTRPRSEKEVNDQDYRFISRSEFEKLIEEDAFLEHAEVFGNLYGTPRDKVIGKLRAGKTVILEIDVQGGEQVKHQFPDAVMIFIFPPTQRTLAERIKNRGRESIGTAELRLEDADDEIAVAWRNYQHMVVNDDLEQAVKEVIHIIKNSRSE